MGDSQNWSSFEDEPAVPKRPSAAQRKKLKQQQAEAEAAAAQTSPLLRPAAVRNIRNRLVFGGLVGFVTGATFGSIDGAKTYTKVHGKLAPAAASSIARGAAITGGSFAGFFLAYSGIKTALQIQRGEDDVLNMGVATVAAGLPFFRSTVMKQNLPYALMLVALDHFHEQINELRGE